MKFLTLRHYLQYLIPLPLTLFMTITIERAVETDGAFTKLYGLPLPYISNSYAFSMCYDIYILPLVFDILFFFSLTVGLLFGIQKLGVKIKTHKTLIGLGVVISIFWILSFYAITFDSFFYWINKT